MDHIYEDDLDFVIGEMLRVAKKWVFLQIAVSGTGGLQGRNEKGYILKKGEPIPIGLEGCAVAGHVTVKTEEFWIDLFERENVFLRRDIYNWFCSLVDNNIISNWIQNSILILELSE